MIDGTATDVASPEYVRRFAMRLHRARGRTPRFVLARRSAGRFTARDLRDAERGRLQLRGDAVADLAALYGIPRHEVLPERGARQLVIQHDGVVTAGGVSRTFEPGNSESLVHAYLAITRALRSVGDDSDIPLRRDDVEAVAQFLDDSGARSASLEHILAMSIAERRVIVSSVLSGLDAAGSPSRADAGAVPVPSAVAE
jgi:hypothetical protein